MQEIDAKDVSESIKTLIDSEKIDFFLSMSDFEKAINHLQDSTSEESFTKEEIDLLYEAYRKEQEKCNAKKCPVCNEAIYWKQGLHICDCAFFVDCLDHDEGPSWLIHYEGRIELMQHFVDNKTVYEIIIGELGQRDMIRVFLSNDHSQFDSNLKRLFVKNWVDKIIKDGKYEVDNEGTELIAKIEAGDVFDNFEPREFYNLRNYLIEQVYEDLLKSYNALGIVREIDFQEINGVGYIVVTIGKERMYDIKRRNIPPVIQPGFVLYFIHDKLSVIHATDNNRVFFVNDVEDSNEINGIIERELARRQVEQSRRKD